MLNLGGEGAKSYSNHALGGGARPQARFPAPKGLSCRRSGSLDNERTDRVQVDYNRLKSASIGRAREGQSSIHGPKLLRSRQSRQTPIDNGNVNQV